MEIDTPEGMPLSPVTFEWEEEMFDTLSIWAPQLKRNRQMKQWFLPAVNKSTFYSGAPILTTVGAENKNALTVAISDVCTPTEIACWIKDLQEQDKLGYSVSFFTGNCTWVGHYTAEIRIDNRRIPYYEAIPAVTAEGENKTITVLYASQPYTFTGKACDVFVSGEESGLIFENPTETALKAEIFDCFGKLLETRTVAANSIVRLPVPRTGRVDARPC